jgi:hypothetical protein
VYPVGGRVAILSGHLRHALERVEAEDRARDVAPVAHEGARPEAERAAAPGPALDERPLDVPRDDLARDELEVEDARAMELRVHAHGAEVAQDRLALRRVDVADLKVAAQLAHALVAAVRLDEHLSLREGLEQVPRELLGLAERRLQDCGFQRRHQSLNGPDPGTDETSLELVSTFSIQSLGGVSTPMCVSVRSPGPNAFLRIKERPMQRALLDGQLTTLVYQRAGSIAN